MFPHLFLSAAVTPSGDPTLKPGLDPASVTPGLPGFLATLFMVVVVILLIRDMVKRVRRVRYAAEVEEARAQRTPGGELPRTQAPGPDGAVTPKEAGTGGNLPERPDVLRPGGAHGPDNR